MAIVIMQQTIIQISIVQLLGHRESEKEPPNSEDQVRGFMSLIDILVEMRYLVGYIVWGVSSSGINVRGKHILLRLHSMRIHNKIQLAFGGIQKRITLVMMVERIIVVGCDESFNARSL